MFFPWLGQNREPVKKGVSRANISWKQIATEFRIRVCRDFFQKTIGIGKEAVETALKGKNDNGEFVGVDGRGRASSSNKTGITEIEAVRSHIESFPKIESHYCRASTNRHYLDSQLNIKKMYKLYIEKCEKNEEGFENVKKVHFQIYRKLFCDNFNISFFKPKKDKCTTCEGFKNVQTTTGMENENEDNIMRQQDYQAHLQRKTEMRTLKTEAKKRATKDNTFHFATFDLQAILQLPCADASPMYYKRKIILYNLTFYNGNTNLPYKVIVNDIAVEAFD